MARVLIVEDEPITAADLELKLAALGHQVAASLDNGEDVVARAPALAADLVLMDIRLHGAMSGIEAAQRLRAQSDVPIVYLTAFADQETIDRACETQPHGYLVKPFTERSVASAVQVALTRARVEREHVERERWMSTALRGAGEALVAVDERGAVRFVNEHAEALLNAKERDVLGKDVRALVRFAQPTKNSTNPFDGALRDGQVTVSPARAVSISNRDSPLYIAYSAAPVLDASGARVGAVMVFHETSSLEGPGTPKLAERPPTNPPTQLSHRINNPLTYNLGALQLAIQELDELRAIGSLTKGASDPAAARRQAQLVHIESLLRGAHEGATRIADVMREFGRPSRPETDVSALQPAALLDLAIGVSGVEALRHVRLERQVDDAPMIRGNKWELAGVLAQALRHALDGAPASGPEANRLTVRAGTDHRGWAEIRISVSCAPGSGFPARGSSKQRLEDAPALAAARRVFENYGGELLVIDQLDGCEVQLRFPPMSASTAAPGVDDAPRTRRANLLVVDDEPAVARVLEMTLRREYDVTTVNSAASALALLNRGDPFDVVLCDLTMPEMDGRELYERLCLIRPEIAARMIFMSGGATTDRAEHFLDEMADRRVDKPFHFERLLKLLRERTQAREREAGKRP